MIDPVSSTSKWRHCCNSSCKVGTPRALSESLSRPRNFSTRPAPRLVARETRTRIVEQEEPSSTDETRWRRASRAPQARVDDVSPELKEQYEHALLIPVCGAKEGRRGADGPRGPRCLRIQPPCLHRCSSFSGCEGACLVVVGSLRTVVFRQPVGGSRGFVSRAQGRERKGIELVIPSPGLRSAFFLPATSGDSAEFVSVRWVSVKWLLLENTVRGAVPADPRVTF